jgi:hypothetical protein
MATVALTARAAKRVTVAELVQAVTTAESAHKPDSEIVRQINGMELTERLSEFTLDHLSTQVAMSPTVALALQLLADQSAFLDLPASELPAAAAPDQAAQLKMFDAAAKYVAETLLRLPNLLATRTTSSYDDSPQEVKKGTWPVRAGLHLVDRSSREISIYGEQENQSAAKGSAHWQQQRGLTSWGEFGSVLGMILADSVKGNVIWSHWEQTSAGLVAVFRYTVPKSSSHFEVVSPLDRQSTVDSYETPKGGSRIAGLGKTASENPTTAATHRESRGYHGSLWLDPATGTILFITIEADSKGSDNFQRADMLVEYRAVKIGDSSFTCPVRSLALSKTVMIVGAGAGDEPSQWLNETLFTDYHRFASTTRIVGDEPAPQ